MENSPIVESRRFYLCLLLVFMILFINLLSAYIRHSEAGLGCQPWPQCYAMVGQTVEPLPASTVAGLALSPTETAKRLHRTIATVLVLLIVAVVYQSRQRPANRAQATRIQYLAYTLVMLILVLSMIGPMSYLKTLPGIAVVNILGGIALLATSWTLWLEVQHPLRIAVPHWMRRLVSWALLAVIVQLALGAWVSANFAGTACIDLFTCTDHERVRDSVSANVFDSFWVFRELSIGEDGKVIIDQAQGYIQTAHRVGAGLTAVLLILLGVATRKMPQPMAFWGCCILGLTATVIILGASGVMFGLPLPVVLAHNVLAALLLLSVLRIKLMTLDAPVSAASPMEAGA